MVENTEEEGNLKLKISDEIKGITHQIKTRKFGAHSRT
jgi:hypothetical protein